MNTGMAQGTAAESRVVQVYLHGKPKGEYPLGTKPLLIGRAPQSDIILADSSISRRHAKLFVRNGQIIIRDLGSAHGIIVNGTRVDEYELATGDEFSIVHYRMKIVGPGEQLVESNVPRGVLSARPAPPPADVPVSGPAAEVPAAMDVGSALKVSDLLAAVMENWRLLAASAVVAILVGFFHGSVTPPAYETNASVQVEPKVREIGGPFTDFENSRRVNDALADQFEVLQSRAVLGPVVDNLGLAIRARPTYFPDFGAGFGLPKVGAAIARRRGEPGYVADSLFGLDRFAWSGERLTVETMEVPDDYHWATFTVVANGGERFAVRDGDGVILAEGRVGEELVDWLPSPEPSRLTVATLDANPGAEFRLTKVPRLAAISDLRSSLIYSSAGPESSIVRLGLAGGNPDRIAMIVNEVLRVYVDKNVEMQSQDATRTLQFVQQQIPIAQEKMEIAEARLNELRLQRGSVDLGSDTRVVLDKIVRLEREISTLESERTVLIERFMPEHPRIRALDSQMGRLRQELSETESAVKELPTTEREVLSLSREVSVASELYLSLVNRAQELQVVSAYAATTGNVRVVDYATPPLFPFAPNKQFMIMLYLMLGLGLSGGWVLFKRQLRNAVVDPDLIEARTGLPIYATLPHSDQQKSLAKRAGTEKFTLLANHDPADPAIEGMRSLRTSLQFAFVNSENNILLITGPTAGVGKTFVASNLAAVLANSGRSVVVVDADMRRGTLHEQFGIDRGPGLADAIGGDAELRDITHETNVEGLYVVTAGSLPPNPSELLMHGRFHAQLADLATRFDHVIIDSPPVLAVTDPALLTRQAGVVLLVLKSGVHPMREIEQTTKRLVRVGANLKGIVFNDMPTSSGSIYAYGSNYVYPQDTADGSA